MVSQTSRLFSRGLHAQASFVKNGNKSLRDQLSTVFEVLVGQRKFPGKM